jgi:GNAT superfamily N-acetyltransferase
LGERAASRRDRVVSEVRVRPLSIRELEPVLQLIAEYQRFYGVAEPDLDHNRSFFLQFIAPSDTGELLGAWIDGELVGYACLYWTFSSVAAQRIVVLNDLFVTAANRGHGIGLALIEAAREVARQRGAARLTWQTALDNRRAQRLYERTGAARSAWFEYELDA